MLRYEFADLIVVGGGLWGAWVAWTAQRAGISALLLDQGRPGNTPGATSQTPCPLSPVSCSNPVLRKLYKASLKAFRELEEDVPLVKSQPFLTLAPETSPSWAVQLSAHQEWDRPFAKIHPAAFKELYPQLHPNSEVWGLESEAHTCDFPELQRKVWELARSAGVKCFADTQVKKIDLEDNRPTAVCRGTVYRGRSLVCAAGPYSETLLGTLPGLTYWPLQRDFYHTVPPTNDTPSLPNLAVLFSRHPVFLEMAGDSFSLHRTGVGSVPPLETPVPRPEETKALGDFRRFWLPDYAAAHGGSVEVIGDTRDGQPLLGPHPWRKDVIVGAGFGPWGPWMAPGAAELTLAMLRETAESPFALGRSSLLEEAKSN